MKTILLLLLTVCAIAADFKSADEAFKAGNGALTVLLDDNETGEVETVILPQAKVLRDVTRYFIAHADDAYTDEQMEQIAVFNKGLHNCRQRMNHAQLVKFNSTDKAPKAKAVAKK